MCRELIQKIHCTSGNWRNHMTPDKLGKVIYQSDRFEVRAFEEDGALRVFAFRKVNGEVVVPHGFMRGSSSLALEVIDMQR